MRPEIPNNMHRPNSLHAGMITALLCACFATGCDRTASEQTSEAQQHDQQSSQQIAERSESADTQQEGRQQQSQPQQIVEQQATQTQQPAQAMPTSSVDEPIDPPFIVLDGRFDDWQQIEPLLIDPADAPGEPIDLGVIRVTHDADFVYIKLNVGEVVNLQKIPADASLDLVIDVDGDAQTGRPAAGVAGADAVVTFTAPRERGAPMGVAVSATVPVGEFDVTPPSLNPYDLGLTFAPTHASDRFEIRFDRGVAPAGMTEWFTSDTFTARFIARDADRRVFDDTDVFQYEIRPVAARDTPTISLPARVDGVLRIANWNVQQSALFHEPELFASVLQAIDADVLLFQEFQNRQNAEMLNDWLNEHLPPASADQRWEVVWGAGGGNLRCAIASRVGLQAVPEMHLLTYPDRPDRHLRSAAATINFQGRTILAVTTHLKCCGSAGSSEDLDRIGEVEMIRAGIAEVQQRGGIDGIVIGGDLNLVGSRDPLDVLMTGGDLDGSDLRVAELLQLDERSTVTWHDADQPFLPGRLDYLLFSDSTLRKVNGFVLDTRTLSPDALARHGLVAESVLLASDHFPMVIDIVPAGAAR